jgi:thiamine biosynthesis lipoprotein ApbE
MGCSWTLLWRNVEVDPHDLQAEIAVELEHWERVMSTWREDSDLCRYNRGGAWKWFIGQVLGLWDVASISQRSAKAMR